MYVTRQPRSGSTRQRVCVVVVHECYLSVVNLTSTLVGNFLNGPEIPLSTPCAYTEALAEGATTGCSYGGYHQQVGKAWCRITVDDGDQEAKDKNASLSGRWRA